MNPKHLRVLLAVSAFLLCRPSIALGQRNDDSIKLSLSGILLHRGDFAAVKVGKENWAVEFQSEQQRRQAAKWVGEKVEINGTLVRGSARDPKQVVIRVRSIQRVVHTIRIFAKEDGALKAIWFDEFKDVRDPTMLKQLIQAIKPLELVVRHDPKLKVAIRTKLQESIAMSLSGVPLRRISFAELDASIAPPKEKDQREENPKTSTGLQVSKLKFLAGEWSSQVRDGKVRLYWMAPDRGTMLGLGRTVARSGHAFEFQRIVQEGDRILLYVSPGGRPPTSFRLISQDETSAVFVNLRNDFPQRITYRLEDTRLVGKFQGKARNGKPRSEEKRWWRNDAKLNEERRNTK